MENDLNTAKCIINITLLTPNAKYLVADTKDFYLNVNMQRFEYTRTKYEMILEEIAKQYKLD